MVARKAISAADRISTPPFRHRRLRTALVVVLAAACLLLAGCSSGSDGPGTTTSGPALAPVSARLVAAQATYPSGGPVTVAVELRNVSDGDIDVVVPFLPDALVTFAVTSLDGRPARARARPLREIAELTEDAFLALASGQSVTSAFDLAEQYDLTDAGKYTVAATYQNPDSGARFGHDAIVATTPVEPLTITVLP